VSSRHRDDHRHTRRIRRAAGWNVASWKPRRGAHRCRRRASRDGCHARPTTLRIRGTSLGTFTVALGILIGVDNAVRREDRLRRRDDAPFSGSHTAIARPCVP
jgi:hypothetical protein